MSIKLIQNLISRTPQIMTKMKNFHVINMIRNYSKFLLYFVGQNFVQMYLYFDCDNNTLFLKDVFSFQCKVLLEYHNKSVRIGSMEFIVFSLQRSEAE